jgi:hypothetical protein
MNIIILKIINHRLTYMVITSLFSCHSVCPCSQFLVLCSMERDRADTSRAGHTWIGSCGCRCPPPSDWGAGTRPDHQRWAGQPPSEWEWTDPQWSGDQNWDYPEWNRNGPILLGFQLQSILKHTTIQYLWYMLRSLNNTSLNTLSPPPPPPGHSTLYSQFLIIK